MSRAATAGAWRQAWAGIGRRPLAWLCCIALAGVSLGACLLMAMAATGLRPLLAQSTWAPTATAVLDGGISAGEAEAAAAAIRRLPGVAAAQFVPRDTALAQLAALSPADREAVGQLAGNPLPDVLVVSFFAVAGPDALESAAAAMRKVARVEQVTVELGWYRKLWTLGRLGIAIAAVVAVGGALSALAWLLVAVALAIDLPPARVRLLWQLGCDDRRLRRAPLVASTITALTCVAVGAAVGWGGWQGLQQASRRVGELYGRVAVFPLLSPVYLAGAAGAVLLLGLVFGAAAAQARLRAIRRHAAGRDSVG